MNKLYYSFYFFKSLLFYIPILVLYLNYVLDNPAQVGILLSVKTISVFLLEVPMGYMADKFGRKINLYWSYIFYIIFLILLIYSKNFYVLIFAEILFSISETLSSGTYTALIYDNLKFENNENEFAKLQRNFSFINSIGLAISFILGSYLYSINKKSVFYLSILATFLILFTLYNIKEYPYKKDMNNQKFNLKNILLNDLKKFQNEDNLLKIIIFYSAIITSIFMAIYFYIFPFELNDLFKNKIIYGAFYCIGVLLIGFGGKCQKYVKNTQNFIFYGIIFLLPLFLIVYLLKSPLIIVLFILAMRFFWGIYSTNVNIEINLKISSSDIRATIFSIKNAILNILLGIFFITIGFLNENGIQNYKIIGFMLILILILIIGIKFLVKTLSK